MQPQRTRPQHLRRQQRIHVLKYQTRENFQLACVPGRFGVENVLVGVYEVVYEASLVAETWTVGERWARDLRAWGHVRGVVEEVYGEKVVGPGAAEGREEDACCVEVSVGR
jgi:hypothetical protein